MRSLHTLATLVAAVSQTVSCISLDTTSPDSIKQASSTIAYGLTKLYTNNQSDTTPFSVGTLNKPYYWWEAAAVWGALIDYYTYTNDSSYNPTVTQALLAQKGENNDYLPAAQTKDLGNDDQAFWALACMDALEYGFPNPPAGSAQWIDLATAVWNEQAARWDNATCGGGLRWQIFSFNVGYSYKNAASNAAFFQLSARLARYTGNATYSQWADKTYSWLNATGLVTSGGNVFDGTDANTNCRDVNHIEWSYNTASILLGSSVLYNSTNGSSVWRDRVTALTKSTATTFTNGQQNILTETACEANTPVNCNTDQIAFKGIAARWLAKSTVLAPYIHDQVSTILTASAKAAASSCNGGSDGTTCGFQWTGNSTSTLTGVGEELNALSVIQSLLLVNGNISPAKAAPSTQSSGTTTTSGGSSTSNTTSSATPSSSSYRGAGALHASTNGWAPLVAAVLVIAGQALLVV